MDQASGLLALQDRGPGLALLPGAARCFCAIINITTNQLFNGFAVFVLPKISGMLFYWQAILVEP